MTIDKNYFLTRLANGEDIDVIGEDIAAMMNAAVAEHQAAQEAAAKHQAELEKERYKRELVADMIGIIQEYGMLVNPDAADLLSEYDENDVEVMMSTLDEMFKMMSGMAQLKAALSDVKPVPKPAKTTAKTDDEILNDFLKNLFA